MAVDLSDSALTTRMLILGKRRSIWPMHSTPSISGMVRSMVTTSGWVARAMRTASAPLRARPTSEMPARPPFWTTREMRERIMLESSTIERCAWRRSAFSVMQLNLILNSVNSPGVELSRIRAPSFCTFACTTSRPTPRPACIDTPPAVEKPGLKMCETIWRSSKLSSCAAVYQPSSSSLRRTRRGGQAGAVVAHRQRPLGFAAHQLHFDLALRRACPPRRAAAAFRRRARRRCAPAARRSRAPALPVVSCRSLWLPILTTAWTFLPLSAATSCASLASARVDRIGRVGVVRGRALQAGQALERRHLVQKILQRQGQRQQGRSQVAAGAAGLADALQLALEQVRLVGDRLQAQRAGVALERMHPARDLVEALEDGGLAVRGGGAAHDVVDFQQAGFGARHELAQQRRVGVDRLEQHGEFFLRTLALALQLALELDAGGDVLHGDQQVAHAAVFLDAVEVERQVAASVLAQAVLHRRPRPPTAG